MWIDFVARRDRQAAADVVSELQSKGLCGSVGAELQHVIAKSGTALISSR